MLGKVGRASRENVQFRKKGGSKRPCQRVYCNASTFSCNRRKISIPSSATKSTSLELFGEVWSTEEGDEAERTSLWRVERVDLILVHVLRERGG